MKVRGFRIELGGIEARLVAVEGVSEAVVVAQHDESGQARLVTFYTGTEATDPDMLRARARVTLPDHMVPSAYVRLDRLPRTPNGKVDRKALPAAGAMGHVSSAYEAPQGEVEQALARIWSDVLKRQRVGRHDNFFELGGHSLSAVSLIERMRRRGLHADVRAVFTSRTLAELASAAGAHGEEVAVPPNRIPLNARRITAEMLPLVKLSQSEIDGSPPGCRAARRTSRTSIPWLLCKKDLFHHLLGGAGDAYLLPALLAFETHGALDRFVARSRPS